MIGVRPATEDDVEAIARVLVDTWRSTFKDLLPDEFLNSLSYGQQEERHRAILRRPDSVYVVAEDRESGIVVGFASGGPNRTPTDTPHPGELYAIYLRSAHQGRGIGR